MTADHEVHSVQFLNTLETCRYDFLCCHSANVVPEILSATSSVIFETVKMQVCRKHHQVPHLHVNKFVKSTTCLLC